jgi:hypothetical protein
MVKESPLSNFSFWSGNPYVAVVTLGNLIAPYQRLLEMSSLRSSVGVLLWWKVLVRFRTYKKLSWMLLFFMNALWHVLISWPINGARRNARIFVMILAIACIKPIGQKSRMSFAPSYLGENNVGFVEEVEIVAA